MENHDDFAKLRNVLAIKRLEIPMDTEVNRFIIEFHRRQRAQLLVPESGWSRVTGWMKERAASFGMVPSLSYGCAIAAIAMAAFVGLTETVKVNDVGGQYQFSLLTPGKEATFGMIPASFGNIPLTSKTASAPMTFGAKSTQATTRFVLASSHPGYDASATF